MAFVGIIAGELDVRRRSLLLLLFLARRVVVVLQLFRIRLDRVQILGEE